MTFHKRRNVVAAERPVKSFRAKRKRGERPDYMGLRWQLHEETNASAKKGLFGYSACNSTVNDAHSPHVRAQGEQ